MGLRADLMGLGNGACGPISASGGSSKTAARFRVLRGRGIGPKRMLTSRRCSLGVPNAQTLIYTLPNM